MNILKQIKRPQNSNSILPSNTLNKLSQITILSIMSLFAGCNCNTYILESDREAFCSSEENEETTTDPELKTKTDPKLETWQADTSQTRICDRDETNVAKELKDIFNGTCISSNNTEATVQEEINGTKIHCYHTTTPVCHIVSPVKESANNICDNAYSNTEIYIYPNELIYTNTHTDGDTEVTTATFKTMTSDITVNNKCQTVDEGYHCHAYNVEITRMKNQTETTYCLSATSNTQ